LQHFQEELRVPPLTDFLHAITLSAAVFITSSLTVSTAVFIPPYASTGRYLVYCVFVCRFAVLFFLFFFRTVTDFSAAEKDRAVKFCKRVGLLSGQVFSHFGGQRSKVKVTGNKKRATITAAVSLA